MAQYPCMKIVEGSDGLIHFMSFADQNTNTQYAQRYIGQGLIDFVELDLSEFEQLLQKIKAVPLTTENYQTVRDLICDTAESIKDKHSYVFFFLVGLVNNILATPIYILADIDVERLKQLDGCIHELQNIVELQQVFKEAVAMCLDKESHSDKIMSKRLCEFVAKYPGFGDATVKIKYELMPRQKGKVDIDTLRDIYNWKLTEVDDLLEIMHQDGEGVSFMPYYLVDYVDEMLYFEFTEMLKNGQFVKRCKLCGRYFILTDKRKRDFCDRVYKGGRTCKQVGGKLFFNKNVADDDYLIKYNALYNKVYSRRYRADGKLQEEYSGRDMTEDEFSAWSEMASQTRRDYLDEKISGDEMLKKIKIE